MSAALWKVFSHSPCEIWNPCQTNKPRPRQRVVISCFNAGTESSPLPVGFSWGETLTKQFPNPSRQLILLLHGDCLKYGLKNQIYSQTYGCEKNPFARFLAQLTKQGIQLKICHLCLVQDGFSDQDVLPFVRPVPFSIDYLLREEKSGAFIVYDARLQENPNPCLELTTCTRTEGLNRE